jgi:hypothetical protein
MIVGDFVEAAIYNPTTIVMLPQVYHGSQP